MFFKTFAEKQVEAKGHDYDDVVRKAKAQHERDRKEIAELKAEVERLKLA